MPKTSTTSTMLPEYYDYEEDTYKIVFNISTRLNLLLQIATVILNFLHLIVLLRKDLRSFAIYIFMIGICIFDILTNSIDFTYIAGEISWMPILFAGSGEISCLRDDYSEVNVGAQILATLLDISRRLSVWLAILMAIMRNLSVLYPTNQRIQSMSKSKGALIILGICVLFWVVFNTWHFVLYRIFWLPDNANAFCKKYYKSSITPRYILAAPSDLHGIMLDWGFIEIIMKFAATICYPILTISLLITLRKIKNRRKKSDKKEAEKPDHTTKLILLLTIFFMLSEGFAGVLALFQYNMIALMEIDEEFVYAINAAQYPVSVLRTLNALSHPIVCYLLSSQYRDAVKGIFIGKKKLKKLGVTRSTSNVRSRTTTSTIG